MDESVTFRPTAPRLMDQVRETLRFYHYAYNTEKSYVEWVLKFIRFSGKKHPREMGKFEIERFLGHLAVNRNVAASDIGGKYHIDPIIQIVFQGRICATH